MTTELTSDYTFQGFPIVRMQNPSLRVEVLPGFGGKIWSLEHRPSAREFLWHNPRQRLRRLPLGASYDDHFSGGFDELLPNDVPEKVNGENLLDHGELWTTPLQASVKTDHLVLSGRLPITPLEYRKTVHLEGSALILEYSLSNVGRSPLDLLWKLHPALGLSQGAELIVPAATARVADPQWSRIKDREEFPWPSMPALHHTLNWRHGVPLLARPLRRRVRLASRRRGLELANELSKRAFHIGLGFCLVRRLARFWRC